MQTLLWGSAVAIFYALAPGTLLRRSILGFPKSFMGATYLFLMVFDAANFRWICFFKQYNSLLHGPVSILNWYSIRAVAKTSFLILS